MIEIPHKLHETARLYIELEARVNEAVTVACQTACRSCSAHCCAIRFCRESVDSHWLRTIAAVSGDIVGEFDGMQGWLRPNGCRLRVGRPPVCYEFFCEAITGGEDNLQRRYALKVLGRLAGFAGKNAIGNRHLITLSSFEIENRLQLDKLRKRLESTGEIFGECREILRVGKGRLERLKPVMALPKETGAGFS